MATACYTCGAHPGHKMKQLDTFKLIKCGECNDIACLNHRKGLAGGSCAKCGSQKSSLVAIRGGESAKKGKTGMSSASQASPESNSTVTINKDDIKELKKAREDSAIAAKKQQEEQKKKQSNIVLSKKEQQIKEKQEESLKKLLGEKKLIMSQVPESNVDGNNGPKSALQKSNENKPGSSSSNIIIQSSNGDDNDKSSSSGITITSGSSDAENLEDDEDKKLKDLNEDSETGETAAIFHANESIRIVDSFYACINYVPNFDDISDEKTILEKDISKFINHLVSNTQISTSINIFTPYYFFSKLSNNEQKYLEHNNINIITGVLNKTDLSEINKFISTLKSDISTMPYLKGLYAFLDDKSYLSKDQQLEIVIQILDIAQENNKDIYLGNKGFDISVWAEIFNEYDLSEINFIFIDAIKNDDELQFIKDNNIKLLIRPDSDLNYYSKLPGFKNFCFGSGFEKSVSNDLNCKFSSPLLVSTTIQKMHKIDKILIEKLLNLPETG